MPPSSRVTRWPTLGQVGEHRLAVLVRDDLGAQRDLDHQIRRAGARAVAAHPVPSALGLEVLGVAEVDQRIEAGDRLEHDVPALAAVSAVGPAIFDVFLAPEAHSPRPARAGANEDLGLVEEMHGLN